MHLFFRIAYFPPLECELLEGRGLWGVLQAPPAPGIMAGLNILSMNADHHGPDGLGRSPERPGSTMTALTIFLPQLNSRDEKHASSDLLVVTAWALC